MRILSIFLILFYFLSGNAYAASLVNIDSAEGIRRLNRSDAKVDFFPLANHFESQQNKVFCGIASTVIVLNTLRLDNPNFKKPQDNSLVSKKERKYLPKGVDPIFERYTQNIILNDKTKSKMEIFGQPVDIKGEKKSDYGLQLEELATLLSSHNLNVIKRVANETIQDNTIKQELINNLKTKGDYILVNYYRKPLGQGDYGHISPLGAYDRKSDSFLIMDVNPNASKWVWVKAKDLISAMRTFDILENRGYVLVKEQATN